MGGEEEVPDRQKSPLREAGLVGGGLALGMAVTTILGALAGRYADQRWGTAPWLTLAGTLLGMAGGFFEVLTVMRRMERDIRK